MRHAIIIAAALLIAAPFGAQAQQKQPAQKGPPPPAPARPYTPIAVKLPGPFKDPSFEAFRKQLGEVAAKKDRAGLARLVVAQGFFWDGEKGDQADKKKSGIDNLSAAIGLAGKEPVGWDMLQGYAQDPTAGEYPGKQGVICGPADPELDEKQLEEVSKATGADPGEFVYPLDTSVEVRSAPRANAPVIEKLGTVLIRIMPDPKQAAPASPNEVPLVRVVTPSGKVGYISADVLSALGNDQLCYVKDAGGWKISGYVGAGPGPQ
ncbi:MAG: hypothetical protein AB7V13_21435 [Pseudorhodoplanes sp.]|uniref:hypothetical protein n=1 Tax=Pseudorhodoplanes sp. TaxID=1934341 RepID=UPI003D1020CD